MRESGSARVIICRVGPERVALAVSLVREVVAAPPVARLPGAPPAVRGVANVRGALVTVISGAVLLGHADATPGEWLVVLTMRHGRIGLEVDEVEDLQSDGAGSALPHVDVEMLIRPLLATDSIEG